MSALAKLVEQGLMAADWAEALAPVEDRIAELGQFPVHRSSRCCGAMMRGL